MYSKFILTIQFFLVSIFTFSNQTDSLLMVLDHSIKNRNLYLANKENNLLNLKKLLNSAETKTDQFLASQKITKEYSYFVNDSALFYSGKSCELAFELGNRDYITESLLDRAKLLSNSELFYESFKLLESIDIRSISDKNKAKYYNTYIYVLKNQINDINDMYYRNKYNEDMRNYIDSYLVCESIDHLEYKKILAYKYYLDGRLNDVDCIITEILNDPHISSNQHAEFLFNIGRTFLEADQEYREKAKYYLILASIEYNQYAITKKPAIQKLANLFLDEKDSKKAYEYINLALQDAVKFNNNQMLRDTEKAYSLIQNTYYAQIEQQQRILRNYLILISIFSIILIFFFIYLYLNNLELKKTRKTLSQLITILHDKSYIMEAFVGHYLDLYYTYIIKLNDHRNYVLNKVNAGKYEEIILHETKALREVSKNKEKIFSDFDRMFITLYPNFVQSVNDLLLTENQYTLRYDKKNNTLKINTEIRILALIKLGITDNKKIASFLKISMQTVYNYRSKIKAKAINEIAFEENVKLIHPV